MKTLTSIRSSMKIKLITLVVSLALVPLLLFGAFSIYENFAVLEDLFLDRLENTVRMKEAGLEEYIHQTEQLAENVQWSDAVSEYVDSQLNEDQKKAGGRFYRRNSGIVMEKLPSYFCKEPRG